MMHRMGLRHQQTDTVVIGRFNPHIITPDWLRKVGISRPGEDVSPNVQLSAKAIILRFDVGEYTWSVDAGRLVISTETSGNTAEKAAAVLNLLPHTPVTAVGSNFRYRCNVSEWRGRLPKLDDVGMEGLADEGEVRELTWKASVKKANGVILNAQVSVEPAASLQPDVVVSVNCHREVSEASEVASIAAQFSHDRDVAIQFIETVFRERVES